MKKNLALTIVLPAYNEEGNIEKQTAACFDFLDRHAADGRVIVVNDGSKDGTGEILKRLQTIYPALKVITHETNKGYGVTLRDGFLAVETPWFFYTDSDNQFDVNELADLLPLTSEYDAVVGYRKNREDNWLRKFMSWGFNTLAGLAFRVPVRDIDCSFKLFKREIFDRFTIESDDFFVDCEVLAKLIACGYRMKEVGVNHYPRLAGCSTVRPGDIPKTLRTMFKLWRKVRDMKRHPAGGDKR